MKEEEERKIRSHPLFRGIEETVAAEVFSGKDCFVRNFSPGTDILTPNTPERLAGLLLCGKATVTTPNGARPVLMRYLRGSDLFGIANLFSATPFVSVIRAQNDCRVFFLREAAVSMLLERDRGFLYRYLGFLNDRIRYLNRKIGYLTAGGPERRLALYLSSFGSGKIEWKDSISSLSELLDVGRASLYRAFDRLIADGFLIKEGRTLIIPDPTAMLNAYR